MADKLFMKMIRKISDFFIYFLILISIHVACTQSIHKAAGNIIFEDNFQKDTKNWIAEFEQPVGSTLKIGNGILDINAAKGATVWYKKKLSGNVMITYTATVIDSAGKNERVSDLNVFWMASNPKSDQMFQQNGKFSSYDNLHLYYAGIGGHDNSTTRFRKYAGSEGKEILKEYTDKEHLLEGNKKYAIKIVVDNGLVQYFINEILFWEFKDAAPYKEGYFGFRTTTSHQTFENFKVYKLK
ncbi:DUF6250 domain-containing protein [Lacibacter sp. H407]|uniref:DUF6250 domain-containing protein n=1 Tax=Lacibacter sp. H407 TaxID=3133423 RepID=UPI0030C63566